MKQFRVLWEIDIYADTAKEAAEKALEIQRDANSMATFFEVHDGEGHIKGIDLLDEES
jgi:hypothetical protein